MARSKSTVTQALTPDEHRANAHDPFEIHPAMLALGKARAAAEPMEKQAPA